MHALGDPTRRILIKKLSEGLISVSHLSKPINISLAAVVQYLQLLEESGLVRTEKVGRIRTCRLAPAGFEVARRWLKARRSLWERRFDRLGTLLAEPGES